MGWTRWPSWPHSGTRPHVQDASLRLREVAGEERKPRQDSRRRRWRRCRLEYDRHRDSDPDREEGDTYFELHVYGFPIDETKTMETILAKEVVANLK